VQNFNSSHPVSCRKFYKCYNGRAYLMDCPAAEHWSVKLDRCDYPNIAKCKITGSYQMKKRPTPLSVQAANSEDQVDELPETGDFEIDNRCEGGDPFKPLHFKHPNDCSRLKLFNSSTQLRGLWLSYSFRFYKCYLGRAYVIKCPKGQQWSQRLNR